MKKQIERAKLRVLQATREANAAGLTTEQLVRLRVWLKAVDDYSRITNEVRIDEAFARMDALYPQP